MSALLDTSVIVRYITGDSALPVRTFDRRFPGDGIELLTPTGGV